MKRGSPCLLVLAAFSLQAQQHLGAGPNLYSPEKEAAIGAELAEQVTRNAPPVNNPAALKYVQQMGARLAAQLPNAPFPFTLALIGENDNPAREPLALPGGYIFVPVNLFVTARDESEFAGMLAHAMAQSADRAGTRQATQGTIQRLASIPITFYGGVTTNGTRQTSGVMIPVAFLQFSRENESRADALAVGMMSGAGYEPEALLRYLTREQDMLGRSVNQVRLDHLRAALQAPAPSSNDEFLSLQGQFRNSKN